MLSHAYSGMGQTGGWHHQSKSSTIRFKPCLKYILIECTDLVEIERKYFEERSLYPLFRNVILEAVFYSLECFTTCLMKN